MSSNIASNEKLILVIGATGAQGLAVIDRLLAPADDGSPSPYTVRALTRDPKGRRARELTAKGVECVPGSFDDFSAVAAALKGVYGAWVNTDGFTVGEMKEVWTGIRIFELAQQAGLKHYVYSALEYSFGFSGWDPKYVCAHVDAKGRVADWMKSQPSATGDKGMTWSMVYTGPYMDMLYEAMFGPVKRRPDGTVVFASPMDRGHVPMIALADIGFWARYTFDNRETLSGESLKVASEWVNWNDVINAYTKVTGQKAEFIPLSVDQWFKMWANMDRPFATEAQEGDISWKENFSGWWNVYRDELWKRDLDWLRKVNPKSYTLEKWMRENNYGKDEDRLFRRQLSVNGVLKHTADGLYPLAKDEFVAQL
ncbi:NAD(P)-binding protein [Wolfiporia cocos MD-104 SS10]|uniref:NAD(P)-binding protein n=1 Tax=Wolfiporia cocos (strain MD-104) TaxID=742152 RepID=A0A2H3J3M0_WOLCO|nr:NAD(P)-binding protein [Wolfiporia cocos MD-104 SS10]